MRSAKVGTLSKLCSLYSLFSTTSTTSLFTIKVRLFCTSSSFPSSLPKDSTEVFQKFGCGEAEISKIFDRHPALLRSNPIILSSKLTLLLDLGLTTSDLVKIIQTRPRILSSQFGRGLSERLDVLKDLFKSQEELLKAITRNPSLLTYNQNLMRNCLLQYEKLGLSKQDLVAMLQTRPTLFPRTSFDNEKLQYIKQTGQSKDDKMYKYIVSIIGVSRLNTIREKVMNIEKFGFTNDQVWFLFGKSPLLLTLSADKVHRNMTFVVGTLKLSATVVLQHPFFLYCNLESWLKPRYLVGEKIKFMGLSPELKGPTLLTGMRMREPRFLKVFIDCHPKDVADELIKVYTEAKSIKRLAETSKRYVNKGFPF
ncbi:hypothetical protein ACHQM5_008181 [Ranunculus cassubicifolius]